VGVVISRRVNRVSRLSLLKSGKHTVEVTVVYIVTDGDGKWNWGFLGR
jgi:hypothetical protein